MTDARTILSVLVSSGLVVVAASMVGAPLALVRSSSRTSLARFVIDAFGLGLFTLLVGVTIWTWLGWVGLLVCSAALIVVVTWAFRSDPPTPDHLRALRPRPGRLAAAVGALMVLAAVPRLRSINYVAYTGDQGAYVNWANRFARQPLDAFGWLHGPDVSSFPPLFSVFLAIPSWLLGPVHTTSTIALTGVLLLAVTLRLLDQLDARPTVRVASVILVGWHVHAVWFSNFPLSESLQAPLAVLFLSCCIDLWTAGADRSAPRRFPVAEFASVTILAMALGFNRGTAPLFMAPLLVILAGTAVPAWRAHGPQVARSCAAALIGFGATHLYSTTQIRQYYVVDQIGKNLGQSTQERLDRLHLLSPSIPSVGLIVVGVVALLGLARWLEGRPPAVRLRRAHFWPLALTTALAALCLLAGTWLASSEIRDQIDRIGRPLALVALAGLLLPRAVTGMRGLAATFAAVTGLSMLVIQSSRLGDTRMHSQFLYWDRYLFSELFPMMVLLAAMAATAGIEAVTARDPAGERTSAIRTVASAAPVLLAVVAGLVATPTMLVALADEPNDNAIQFLIGIDDKLGDDDLPVLWGSTDGSAPPDFGFPNTWHAYAIPLDFSFDHRVLNLPMGGGAFVPDPVLSTEDLVTYTACLRGGSVRVVEWDAGGPALDERVADPDLTVEWLGSEAVVTPRLNQPHRSRWARPVSRVDVFEVRGTPDATADCLSLSLLPG